MPKKLKSAAEDAESSGGRKVSNGVWQVDDGLYVADKTGASDGSALKRLGIRFVVNLGGSSFNDLHSSEGLEYLNLAVEDIPDAELPLEVATDFIHKHLPSFRQTSNQLLASSSSEQREPAEQQLHQLRLKRMTGTSGRGGGAVLVHCRGAHSRSLSIIAAYWLKYDHTRCPDVGTALTRLVQARGLQHINPGFLQQLEAWSKQPLLMPVAAADSTPTTS